VLRRFGPWLGSARSPGALASLVAATAVLRCCARTASGWLRCLVAIAAPLAATLRLLPDAVFPPSSLRRCALLSLAQAAPRRAAARVRARDPAGPLSLVSRPRAVALRDVVSRPLNSLPHGARARSAR
jgi:hypothetical protein